MVSLGLDLSQPALETIRNNVLKGLPYVALVLLVTATSYYQQRQVTLRSAGQAVNPQQQLLLDVNRLNNARRAQPDGRAAAHWGTRLVFWLQQVLALAGL